MPNPANAASQHKTRILFVEDDLISQLFAEDILTNRGFLVDIASNGAEALTLLDKEHYALVLMDCLMPVMDGYQTSQVIRSNPRFAQLPIIAMTASLDPNELEHCLANGMNDYIAKPIDWQALYRMFDHWLKPVETTVLQAPPKSRKYPILPGVDMDAVDKQLNGNFDIFLTLIKQFPNHHAHTVEELRSALHEKDYDNACQQVHKLRGSANLLGLTPLIAISQALEQSLIDRQVNLIPDLLEELDAHLQPLLKAIKEL